MRSLKRSTTALAALGSAATRAVLAGLAGTGRLMAVVRSRLSVLVLVAGLLAAFALAPSVSAQVQAGDIFVADIDTPPSNFAALFGVDPQTGARAVLNDFGGGNDRPEGLAVEADGRILVADPGGPDPGGQFAPGALYRIGPPVDPQTGHLTRTTVSDFGDSGANGGRLHRGGIAVQADGGILVNVEHTSGSLGVALVRVDPQTGARTILSDFGDPGQGPGGFDPRGVAVEADGGILVVDPTAGTVGKGALLRIDPQTGARTRLSDFGVGANQGGSPAAVAVEADGRILVVDEFTVTKPRGLLFRVDPLTGARTVLSDFEIGANPGAGPRGVAVEADGQILVIDVTAGTSGRGTLFRIDPQTGDRTILSNFGVGDNQGANPVAVAVVPDAAPPECSDGIDNDVDARIDHPADRQCESPSDPSERSQCSDGLDNDGDGQVDRPDDTGCSSSRDNSESPTPQCSDGVDNDVDGAMDYPADTGCKSIRDVSESPTPQCSDGVDNDVDGATDYLPDTGCSSPRDDSESPNPQCSDGVDNDVDGATDYPADTGCNSVRDNSESPDPHCSDGVDNDVDGAMDYPADPGCKSIRDKSESPNPQCSDGIDNDVDGATDYLADPSCRNTRDNNESA